MVQNPYVLCRLFHKTGKSHDGLSLDEGETTRTSPATSKSFLEDTPSDVGQEAAALDTQVIEQVESKQWFTDKSDNLNLKSTVPVENAFRHTSSEVPNLAGDDTKREVSQLHLFVCCFDHSYLFKILGTRQMGMDTSILNI